MAASKGLPYLITYDISNRQRLQRVHRTVSRRAIALQYSVFFAVLTPAELAELKRDLALLIDEKADDIRLYTLPQKPEWHAWGTSLWPSGITISGIAVPDPKS